MMDLYSITRRSRREYGLSQGDLAKCLQLPKESVIALESYLFVELDERQLEILAIYSDTLLDMVRKVYATEQDAYMKAQKRKSQHQPSVVDNASEPVSDKATKTEATTASVTGANVTRAMEEITELVNALPEKVQAAVISSFKAQLQCMVLDVAS